MLEYTTKFEINLLKGSEAGTDIGQLNTFVIKNRVPAVVAEPEYIQQIICERNKHLSRYKIICAIDFRNGCNYAMEKVRDLPQYAMFADGFEVLVTRNRSDKESLNELRALSEFFKRAIDQTKEIRWALALRTRQPSDFSNVLEHMRKWPASFIRTDVNIESPLASVAAHISDIAVIRAKLGTPIKVSGNVDLETISELRGEAARFDVTYQQAQRILKKVREVTTRGNGKVDDDGVISTINEPDIDQVLANIDAEEE